MGTETLSPNRTHRALDATVGEQVSTLPSDEGVPVLTIASGSPSAAWAQSSIRSRLQILRKARHHLATRAPELAAAIPGHLSRTPADTLVAEVLPLLEAMKFLEREAAGILRTRRLGRRGLPFWLAGVDAEIRRVPFGKILVIGPANYPLFLPGVQVMQAIAAGNTVVWKPGHGGRAVAAIVADSLLHAGLPAGVLEVTEDTIEAAQEAISNGADKVFFTGSGATGRLLLRQLAGTATPAVVELSGNDAVVVLPSANLHRVVAALTFGMRLNGSATCMAPRRVLLVDFTPRLRAQLIERLRAALSAVPRVTLTTAVHRQLQSLIAAAEGDGATVIGDAAPESIQPILLLDGTPSMEIARCDLFAPVLTLIEVRGSTGVLEAQEACPLALTTSIFGGEREARALAASMPSGTVTINDLIVSTADPRVPFGGRRSSGFGVTRGAEGLLEMTAVKVVSVRRGRSTRHYEPTGEIHAKLFAGLINAAHAGSLSLRWSGLKRALIAGTELKKK